MEHNEVLETVAINNVLPLKAATTPWPRPNIVFGPGETSNLISTVSFIFTMRHHLILVVSQSYRAFMQES